MSNRFNLAVVAISMTSLLMLSGCGQSPSAGGEPIVSDGAQLPEKIHHQISDETGDAIEHLIYDSHAECAELQPSGEYCEMHGGHSNHGGVWIEPTQLSREDGLTGIIVSIIRAGDSALYQPGTGPDLSGLVGNVLPFALTLDTHAGDISALDLNGRVFLVDSSGTEIPGMVRRTYDSAHHPVFVVAFPKQDSYGKPLDAPAVQPLSIVVRDVGVTPERLLKIRL